MRELIKTYLEAKERGITLKGLKSMEGNEGLIWQAVIYRDGKKAGDFLDEGNGGMPRMKIDPIAMSILEDIFNRSDDAKNGSTRTLGLMSQEDKVTMVLSHIADEMDFIKRLTRMCKSKTVAHLAGDPEDAIITFNVNFNPVSKASIKAAHPDIEYFVNEELEALVN